MFKGEFGGEEDGIDKIKDKIEKWEKVFRNYETERESILTRLKNPALSLGKKGKLSFRLGDINFRLLPELRNKISHIQPLAII